MNAEVIIPSGVTAARDAVLGTFQLIPWWMGRCYGDSSLSATVISTDRFSRMRSLQERDGLLSCEAGVSLGEIVETFGPRGWFLPVTPGTKFVTVGGAIASDFQGKYDHRDGSFSKHLVEMEVLLGNGEVVTCSLTCYWSDIALIFGYLEHVKGSEAFKVKGFVPAGI